jgi:hypothetical protein
METPVQLRWDIVPHKGVGPLFFGMTRNDARAKLGTEFTSFRKSATAASESDAFDELGVHLYYDDNDGLEFIETFQPCSLRYKNAFLLGDVESVIQTLNEVGLKPRNDDGSYFFVEPGFVLFAPTDVIEAVSVYRKDYYDESD